MLNTWDIKEGHKGRYTKDGWEIERVVVVSEISRNYTGYERMWQAFLNLGLDIGDSHPDFIYAYLYDFMATFESDDAIKFVLKYRERGNIGNIKVEATQALRQEESNVDRNDSVITVSYGTETQGALIPKLKPEGTLVVRVRENNAPYGNQNTFVGKINDRVFYGAGDTEKWMCMSISGSSDDGIWWDNIYTFQYNPEGWTVRVVYIDPATGKPPPDLVNGVGYKLVDMYDKVDFTSIGFTF